MPIFRYKGYAAGGGSAAGTIEAEGPHDAALKLKAQGLHPWEITSEEHTRRSPLWDRIRGRESVRLPALTRQLSILIGAGVPLVEALRASSREKAGREARIMLDIRERVAGGSSLARALEAYPDVFPDYYRGMVEAGENSGALDDVLGRMAEHLEAEDEMAGKVRAAMVYPLFMASVSMIVLSFLFAFVVPKIVKLFENSKVALPLSTRLLIAISNVLTGWWWLILIAGVCGVGAWRVISARHRIRIDKLTFSFMRELYIARLARALSFLLEGGMPFIRSLELAGRAAGNEWLKARCSEASESVQGGSSLSGALSGGGLPPVFIELVATGERSGKLSEVLGHAARGYEADYSRKVQRSLALLEPALILLMGAVVGFIVFAVLLPMFQLNQLIR